MSPYGMLDMNTYLEPGMVVTNPAEPDWGRGQVQSVISGRVTVNFEHRGKVVIDTRHVVLVPDYGTPHP